MKIVFSSVERKKRDTRAIRSGYHAYTVKHDLVAIRYKWIKFDFPESALDTRQE